MRHPDGSTTWSSPVGRTYDRPSPHPEPPHVDLRAELPPLRPRPSPAKPAEEGWHVPEPLSHGEELTEGPEDDLEDDAPPF